MSNREIKWAAQVAHVREVSLLGTADLAFWTDRLKREDLLPADRDGKAQIMIVAAALKWMGVRFRELSVSVLVRPDGDGDRRDAAYLLHAWSSSRFLAACERVFFSTPYSHADVRLSAAGPASIQLIKNGEIAFRAEMGADGSVAGRESARRADDGWSGPVFLPGNGATSSRGGRMFFARIAGLTETHAFRPAEDLLTILPARDCDALAALLDSHFVPEEWAVRPDATHAKSKTYRRTVALA